MAGDTGRGQESSVHLHVVKEHAVPERDRLLDTQRAFDRVAGSYDGPSGNNELIQRMRVQMWQTVTATFLPGARLLDLGCGTGLDTVYFAAHGYSVLAVDWSPAMVDRTRARIAEHGLQERASALLLGAQDLQQLGPGQFDGIYSNLGPLNCAPDLRQVAHACGMALCPGGRIVASVIGRICPWEIAYYLAHGHWTRALLRWKSQAVPVPMSGETVWCRYLTPRQFYAAFAVNFMLTSYRGMRICSPPPYMLGVYARLRPICSLGEWLDEKTGHLPIIRNAGDHFLMTMTKRA